MVNKATEKDVAKIKRLIASAISAREKAMYESLLDKAKQQIAEVKNSETATKVAKKSDNTSQRNKKEVVAAEEIVAPGSEIPEPTVKSDKSSSPSLKETVTEQLQPEKKGALPGAEANVAMFQALKD
jgi:hypothetical protein